MSKATKKNPGRTEDPEVREQFGEASNTGAYLRKLRKDKGLSLEDVSRTTRISITNLRALEEQDYAVLPADTFTRGFLNIYARFLGADPAQVTADFLQERDQSLAQDKQTRLRYTRHTQTAKRLAEPSYISSITMAGILLFIIVAILAALAYFTSWNPFAFLTEQEGSIPDVMMDMLPGSEPQDMPLPEAPGSDTGSGAPGEGFDVQSPETRESPAAQDE